MRVPNQGVTCKDFTMKRYKVVPSKAPVTSVSVEGVPWHYFHSKALGRCRAIVILPEANLPAPKPFTVMRNQELAAFLAKVEAKIDELWFPQTDLSDSEYDELMETWREICKEVESRKQEGWW